MDHYQNVMGSVELQHAIPVAHHHLQPANAKRFEGPHKANVPK